MKDRETVVRDQAPDTREIRIRDPGTGRVLGACRGTARELETTVLLRWRLSTSSIQLGKAVEKNRERARLYMRFAELRRLSALGALVPPAKAGR